MGLLVTQVPFGKGLGWFSHSSVIANHNGCQGTMTSVFIGADGANASSPSTRDTTTKETEHRRRAHELNRVIAPET